MSTTTGIFGAGLDVQSIVAQLMEVERQPITTLENQKSKLQLKGQALDSVNTGLTDFYNAIEGLRTSSNFGAKTASSSNSSILSASATSSAVTGTYDMVVNNLASTSAWSSKAFATTSEAITGSTGQNFTLKVGDGSSTVISLDGANNSLEGLKNAINSANAGVRASIAHDSSGYRLMLFSSTSGAAGNITIDGNASSGGPADLGLASKVTGVDASLTVNGIDFTSSTNSVSGAIEGMTFNLSSAAPTSHVTVTVGDDTSKVTDSIQTFVTKYNTMMTYLNQQFTYSTDQSKNSILAGSSELRTIQEEMLSLVSGSVTGLDQDFKNLRQIGIEMNNDGTLTVNQDALDEALSTNFEQVKNLFQVYGSAQDDRVQYVSSMSTTKAGAYSLSITQAAEQAAGTGSNVISGAVAGGSLSITYNGSSTITLADLTGKTLTEIINSINSEANTNGYGFRALNVDNKLKLYTLGYGSGEGLQIDDANNVFGFSGGTQTTVTGKDVQGSIDGGATITGSGRALIGAAGTAAEGLTLQINSDSALTTTVNFSRGYADLISSRLSDFTNSTNGIIMLSKNALNADISDIDDQILQMENAMSIKQEMLISQFTQADYALRNMSAIMSSLNNATSSLSSKK